MYSEILYKIKRLGNSLFTYNCVACEKAVRGKCICKNCLEKLLPPPVYKNGFSFAYYYEGPARDAILCYKFGSDYEFCFDTLCDWLSEAYEKLDEKDFDAAVPVPDFKIKNTRLAVLSKKFCALNKIPFCPELLSKIKSTEKQHKLSAEERRKNVVGAFEGSDSAKGRNILLIDDIYTTGSTVRECAGALYEKGAKKVSVITIAKTRFTE